MKTIFYYLLLSLISFQVLAICVVDEKEAINIGLRIPLWGFMWAKGKSLEDTHNLSKSEEMRWKLVLENLDAAQTLGAKWNIVRLLQEIDGPDGWLRAKKIISEHKKKGLNVVFRLMEQPGIYDDNITSKDPKYGYNRRYYNWVKSLVDNLSDDITYLLIGNEMDHGGEYSRRSKSGKVAEVTYEDYRKILETAIMAVKSTGNTIKILDHGISSQSLGLWVTEKEYRNKDLSNSQDLWHKLHYSRENNAAILSHRRFMSYRVKKRIQFVEEGLSSNQDFDFQQIHYYWSWETLNRVLDEIELQKNSKRKMFAGEVGYRIATQKIEGKKHRQAIPGVYNAEDHAQDLVKKFAILHGRGITNSLYWNIRSYNSAKGTQGLFPSVKKTGSLKPTLPARAYQVLTGSLNGMSVQLDNSNYSNGVYDYRFSCGRDKLAILWVDEIKDGFNYTFNFEVLSAHDKYAKPVNILTNKVKLSTDPIYVWWKE